MLLGHDNCSAEVGKCDPLGGAALTDLKITLLDVVTRLGEQPLANVLQDFLELALPMAVSCAPAPTPRTVVLSTNLIAC